MSTAARPTFEPARGGQGRREKDLSAISRQYSNRDLPSHNKLKNREHGQGTSDELGFRDFCMGLEDREQKSGARKRRRVPEAVSHSKRPKLDQVPAASLDVDDPLDEDSDDPDIDDDTAQLLAELQRIKEQAKRETEKLQEKGRIRMENILSVGFESSSNMEEFGTVFLCNVCGKGICDGKFSCTVSKGNAYVSGVLDGVKKIGRGKKRTLKCSCGENIGEFLTYKKEMKYCLDLEKVRRCAARNSEHSDTESVLSQKTINSLPTGLVTPTLSRNGPDKKVTINGEVADLKCEVSQLKQTIATMEKRVKSLESENSKKLKDVCGVLLSQKMEILRLQEIVWALHPNFNLDNAFSILDKASCFGSNLDTSDNLNIDDV